jgi:hypothetical protein
MALGNNGPGFAGGGGYPTAFRRWDDQRPEYNGEIAVFPHGYPGVLSPKIDALALRHGLLGTTSWEAERNMPAILSVDPWSDSRSDMPRGYYPNATGETRFGRSSWQVAPTRCLVDISYVSWRFFEAGDFSTNVVAKLIPQSASVTVVTLAANRIRAVLQALEKWLDGIRPGPLEIALRSRIDKPAQPPSSPQPTFAPHTQATPEAKPEPPARLVEVTVEFPKDRN